MSKIQPIDHANRDRIEKDIQNNFIVEAGSGSGKTTSLVKRMVSMITTGYAKTEEISAITFTRKAAAELKQRFQITLEAASRVENDQVKKERLVAALLNIEKCFMGTIHSFCSNLLRERPIEAGIDPDFKELEDMQDRLMQKQIWSEYVRELKMSNSPLIKTLDDIGISLKDLFASFTKLNQYTDVEIVAAASARPDMTLALSKLEALLDKFSNALPLIEPDKGWDDLQKAIRFSNARFKYSNMLDIKNVISVFSAFDKSISVTQNRWNSKADAKQASDEFELLKTEIILPLLISWKTHCHSIIIDFIKPAINYYEKRKKEMSSLNFQDLLMHTANMLQNYPEVRNYFAERYKYLLIDEFQDTDPIQAQIMLYLTGEDLHEKDFEKLKPRKGSLFVVGDPKQSIYRFRRADIDTYNLVKQIIVKNGGEVLHLTANFRSVKPLGDWFNLIFKELLPDKTDKYQPQFTSIDTVREVAPKTIFGVKKLVVPEDNKNKANVIEFESNAIAKCIREMIDKEIKIQRTEREIELGTSETVNYKDFMILTRYKDSIVEYAKALEKYAVPYVVTSGNGSEQSIEIYELLSLLRGISDSFNKVELLGVLRGLFFSITDNELYQFKRVGGEFDIYSIVPGSLELQCKSKFEKAFERLKKYTQWACEYPASVFLEKIIVDNGIIPFSLYGEAEKSRCGAVYKIIENIRKFETCQIINLENLILLIEEILETENENLNLLSEEQNAVRIMNLHKAKGLESPIVFLANPAKQPDIGCDFHIQRNEGSGLGYFKIKEIGKHQSKTIAQPINWDDYSIEEDKYLDAEEIRLLYVAATRARNLLIISSWKKNDKNPWEKFITEDMEEIQIPNILPVARTNGSVEFSAKELDTVRGSCINWIKDKSEKSYDNKKTTEFEVNAGHSNAGSYLNGNVVNNDSAKKGTIIHELMEMIVKGHSEVEKQIPLLLKEKDLSNELEVELLGIAKRFKGSELFRRIQKAKNVLTEVPFKIKVDQNSRLKDIVMGGNKVPVYLSGVIDLAFEENDGWIILDYKSSHFETEEQKKNLVKMYESQIKIYCLAWEEMMGVKVNAGEIYFVEKDELSQFFLTPF